MKLGIRAHDFGKMPLDALVQSVQEAGFEAMQLVLPKAVSDERGNVQALSQERAAEIGAVCKTTGVEIGLLGAYFNPIHSNKQKVQAGVELFKQYLQLAPHFGTQYVGTETGSYNDDKWTYHPDNHSDKAYNQVRATVEELVSVAETVGSTVLIEPAYHHVIYSPARMRQLLDDINSPNLKAIVDPFNLIHLGTYAETNKLFDQCVELFGDRIAVVHCKDFVVEPQNSGVPHNSGKAGGATESHGADAPATLRQIGLGDGLMDYPHILGRLKSCGLEPLCVFEGVTGDNIACSVEYIRRVVSKL